MPRSPDADGDACGWTPDAWTPGESWAPPGWAGPRAAMASLALLNSAAAELAFFLALSLVPFVGIAIFLVGSLILGMYLPAWLFPWCPSSESRSFSWAAGCRRE